MTDPSNLFSEANAARRGRIIFSDQVSSSNSGQILISEGHRLCLGLAVRNKATGQHWLFHIHDAITPEMEHALSEMHAAAAQGPNDATLILGPSAYSSPFHEKLPYFHTNLFQTMNYNADYHDVSRHGIQHPSKAWFSGLIESLSQKGSLSFSDEITFAPFWSFGIAFDTKTDALQIIRDRCPIQAVKDLAPENNSALFNGDSVKKYQATGKLAFENCPEDLLTTGFVRVGNDLQMKPLTTLDGKPFDPSPFYCIRSAELSCDPKEKRQQIESGFLNPDEPIPPYDPSQYDAALDPLAAGKKASGGGISTPLLTGKGITVKGGGGS